MNDYWNDPPDAPEPPTCCDEFMDIDVQGNAKCGKCGNVIPREPEQIVEPPQELPCVDDVAPTACPHGKTGECDACDYLGDLAYDAERERRMR